MAASSEEENYVRIAVLLTGVSPRAVRALFDREFAPICLKETLSKEVNKLLDLKKKRLINEAQYKLLFPSGNVESKTFDVTLMICLIRHLTNMVHPSSGFEKLPHPEEITPCADLARIKCYRNYIAHLVDNKIDNSVFSKAWNEISEAIGRLGGSTLLHECKDLKNKILDQSNQEIMLEIKTLKSSFSDLQKEMETLKESYKDTVPWNIRAIDCRHVKQAKSSFLFIFNRLTSRKRLESKGFSPDMTVIFTTHMDRLLRTNTACCVHATKFADVIDKFHQNLTRNTHF